jgi:phosphoglycolate phosphatase-like HAD superfamily hydrolase
MMIKTKVVAWDFDEVIVRGSEAFKKEGFEEIFEAGSKEYIALKEAREFFAHGKGDRFDMFCRALGVTERDHPDVLNVGERFNQIVEKKIRERGIHPDDRKALEVLSRKHRMYIVSNTPEGPLRANVEYFYQVYPEIAGCWDLVLGTPLKKPANLELIRAHENCDFPDISMIGDGENDLQAALDTGCNFVGVTTVENKERWVNHTFPKVHNIAELIL